MRLFLRKVPYLLMCVIGFVMCVQCTNKESAQLNFPKNRWYQSEVLSLDFTPSSLDKSYIIQLNLSYIHGFQFSEIPLEVYITSPLHQVEKTPITLLLFDDSNEELGDCVGDYCDLELIIKDNYQFSEAGNYKIQVLNTFDHEYLPNVLSVSVQVK